MNKVDWARPIIIQSTDWQGELPARVVSGPGHNIEQHFVEVQGPFKIHEEAALFRHVKLYFNPDGTCYGFPDIRVINKGTGDE